LLDRAKQLIVLDTAASVVNWDMETMMPPKGIKLRSEQLALLSQITHRMTTDPKIGELLETIQSHRDYESLSPLQKRNVYLIKKQYDEQTKLPEELVVETARQRAIAIDVWKKAKAAKNFAMFKPDLEKLVELRKKAARILMEVKATATPYDALIDIFEPKMISQTISRIFDDLKPGLIRIMKKCEASPKQPDASILKRRIPVETQREISHALAKVVEYDIDSKEAGGRIDETEHPFTTGYYPDVRITTHYYEEKWASSVFSVLHEMGHAIYGQSLPQDWIFQPVGDGCSLGFHESQSRLVENIVGRSREFWTYFLPRLKQIAGPALADVKLDALVHAINQVKPSKIRVEADEVTYCLHVIIRFEIERELFADKVTVSELPHLWNRKYKEYLGVDIENDSEGVMQDTHWASGSFGYFPTYALGNIYSGQILAKMEKDLPNWRHDISNGRFSNVKNWLIKNVYSHGNLLDPADLIKVITGQEINTKPYLEYLNRKYSQLYEYSP